MDVFDLRERLVANRASYIRRFINIRDDRIEAQSGTFGDTFSRRLSGERTR